MALPISVRLRSVATRNTPGMTIIHQLPVKSAFSERDSMLPHETTSSGKPSPRKLSVDYASIAPRTFMMTINKMDGKKLGARWTRRM